MLHQLPTTTTRDGIGGWGIDPGTITTTTIIIIIIITITKKGYDKNNNDNKNNNFNAIYDNSNKKTIIIK